MVQIIRSIFFHERFDINVTLLYGGNCQKSLAYMDSLLEQTKIHSNFHIKCTVRRASDEEEEEDEMREGECKIQRVVEVGSGIYKIGIIDMEFLKQHCPKPSNDLMIVICGPPKMCIDEKIHLVRLGYMPDMLFSFF